MVASRNFFSYLFSKIAIKNVVWVPGNHDLSLWKQLTQQLVTPYEGVVLEDAKSLDLLSNLTLINDHRETCFRVSYPIFRDVSVGDDYPMLLFTHGHLLDPLVRGLDPYEEYLALGALGCYRPGSLERTTSIRFVAAMTG